MTARGAWALVLAACGAACATAEHEPPTRWLVPPRVDPVRVRVETELFEMPLARAEELYRPAGVGSATVGVAIDETGARGKLLELASRAEDVYLAVRPPIEVAPSVSAPVPPRAASAQVPERALASDRVEIEVAVAISYGWAPFELTLAFAWTDARGRRLGQFSGRTPIPADHALRIVCLPPKERARADDVDAAEAIIGFVRLLPVHEGHATGRLDPREGLRTEHGAIENVGDEPIEYAIGGDLRFHAVDLGERGRARFSGDGAELAVAGGSEARFTCAGDRNVVRARAGSSIGRRSVDLVGRDNRFDASGDG